jgi:hypothetical protein
LEVTGTIDLEPDSFIREEAAKSKPKKYMLSVGTAKRVFMMFAETPVEECDVVPCSHSQRRSKSGGTKRMDKCTETSNG